MIDYKEYSRLRDIAQKRIKRAQEAGVPLHLHIPTVKELRGSDAMSAERDMMALELFITEGFSLERQRSAERVILTQEEKRERKRKQSRRYRRMKVAREYEHEEHPDAYQRYVKGLETLGVELKPSELPAFFAYMDYRFAQGKNSKQYVIDVFVEDYKKMLMAGYSAGDILNDFKKFEADQALIAADAENMYGTDYDKAIEMWDSFKAVKGVE